MLVEDNQREVVSQGYPLIWLLILYPLKAWNVVLWAVKQGVLFALPKPTQKITIAIGK